MISSIANQTTTVLSREELRETFRGHFVLGRILPEDEEEVFIEAYKGRVEEAKKYDFTSLDIFRSLFGGLIPRKMCDCGQEDCGERKHRMESCNCYLHMVVSSEGSYY